MIRNPAKSDALLLAKGIGGSAGACIPFQTAGNPESQDPILTDRKTDPAVALKAACPPSDRDTAQRVDPHSENHAHSMFSKLGVNSRTEAIAAYRDAALNVSSS